MMLISFGKAKRGHNAQLASAYIVYMMAGSCYRDCRLRNPILQEKMRLAWCSMQKTRQLEEEEAVDCICQKVLPADLADLRCDIRMWYENNRLFLEFRTWIPGENFRWAVEPDGRAAFFPMSR